MNPVVFTWHKGIANGKGKLAGQRLITVYFINISKNDVQIIRAHPMHNDSIQEHIY